MRKTAFLFLLLCVSVFPAAAQAPGPVLELPYTDIWQGPATVNLEYTGNGHDIAALVFALEYEPGALEYTGYTANQAEFSVIVDDTQPGRLGVAIFYFGSPLIGLADGSPATLLFDVPAGSNGSLVTFSQDPPVSFGDTQGQSVPGQALDGAVGNLVELGVAEPTVVTLESFEGKSYADIMPFVFLVFLGFAAIFGFGAIVWSIRNERD